MSDTDMLARLSDLIDYESPDLAEVLYRMWGDQQKAITYRELRQAILDGSLALQYLQDWHKDYSKFINAAYRPLVRKTILQAAEDLRIEYGVDFYDPSFEKIDNFVQTRGGKLIRDVTTQQYTAVNTLVREAALTQNMTVDQLARAIRPCVGLTRRQAQTTMHYYKSLIEDGYSAKKAEEKQLVFAAKIHRKRAALIAQTELAYAYSAGWHDTVQQNVEDGVLPPDTKKIWLTAEDEKVCNICGDMNGESVPWYEHFSNGSMYPPAHPNCRCHHKIDFVNLLRVPEPEPDVPDLEDEYDAQAEADAAIAATENERIRANNSNSVPLKALDAPGYRSKFDAVTDIPAVNQSLYDCAVESLNRRTETTGEDLYLINGRTGEIIHALTSSSGIQAVRYDDQTNAAIAKAHADGIPIISLHNHPNGMPPSLDDGSSARSHGYDLGVVVGHNLEVFTYTPTRKVLNVDVCARVHEALSKKIQFMFDFDDEIWYTVLKEFGMEVSRK